MKISRETSKRMKTLKTEETVLPANSSLSADERRVIYRLAVSAATDSHEIGQLLDLAVKALWNRKD